MVDTSCPSCDRVDWVQSVPALHATGVSTVSGTDRYSGIGVAPTGLIPVVGTSAVHRTTTTTLAHATMPAPKAVSITGPMLLGVVLSVLALPWLAAMVAVVVAEFTADDSTISSIVGITLVALVWAAITVAPLLAVFAVLASRVRRNRRVQQGLSAAYAAWNHGSYCHRCGVCFWTISPAPGVTARYPFSPSEFRWVVWNIGGYGRYFNAG